MSPTVHLIQGITGGIILYPAIGEKAIIFGVSVVVIDIDHFIEYYTDTRKFSIKGLFEYHNVLLKNLDGYLGLNLFHTIECYIILFCLGLFLPSVNFILMGFLFHHLFDQIQLCVLHKPFARAFSIVEYLIRRKNYFTTISHVLKKGQAKDKY